MEAASSADPDVRRYVGIGEAQAASGMRLVTTRGVPGPWGEAAKGILYVKRIPYLSVAQEAGEPNDALFAWTGYNNAPVMIWNDEPPRATWSDIVMLVERVASAPALIPVDQRTRMEMFGLLHELCGEDGFGWNRRLVHFAQAREAAASAGTAGLGNVQFERLLQKYPVRHDIARGRRRLITILTLQSEILRAQRAMGSSYYFGNALSAADIYGACFAAMVRPLPPGQCDIVPELVASYTMTDPEILAAADPLILAHRDFIYTNHLELPLRL
jgi:glutathione S-transferase